jgi:hypothetical protein
MKAASKNPILPVAKRTAGATDRCRRGLQVRRVSAAHSRHALLDRQGTSDDALTRVPVGRTSRTSRAEIHDPVLRP